MRNIENAFVVVVVVVVVVVCTKDSRIIMKMLFLTLYINKHKVELHVLRYDDEVPLFTKQGLFM